MNRLQYISASTVFLAAHLVKIALGIAIQDAPDIIPRLLHCLRRLPNCSASSKSPARWQALLSTLFSSLHKVMCLQHFPAAGRQDISQAVQQLLILAIEGPSQTESGSQTNADMLTGLRGAVSLPHHNSALLPLLPDHAAELLSTLVDKHMAPMREGMSESSNHLLVLLLTAQLCKSASKVKILDASLAQQIASVACRSVPHHEQVYSCYCQPAIGNLNKLCLRPSIKPQIIHVKLQRQHQQR